ncbi:Cell wall-associated hydrolase, NlpC family [Micromonospora rhizosphaerae]|uniref:Cell wall-associated hydrolase, NlpC family n=1 Tax=Micromonospora rhizosphaerae TaxID=568872 RepID=A0A1C6R9Y5_9ACTN|nr:C40 family peptidase [Micromonospora rhizosphaerae]SCL13797.1 Cell wall-associated hydrolase, NlpC family [Micromonospora rhizosphaerae]
MPPPPATPPRSRVLARILAAVMAALVAILPAANAHAAPSAAEVQNQIDAAWQKLEPVIEQYNKVRAELAVNKKKSAELNAKIEPLGRTVDVTRGRVQEIATRYYKGGSVSTLNALLSSGSPTALADNLEMLDRLANSEQRQITSLSSQQATYDAEKKTIDVLIARQERQQADLAAKKKTIDTEIKRLEALQKQVAAAEADAAAKAAAARAAAARAAADAQAAATASSTSPIKSTSSLFIGGQCPAVPISGDGGIAAKTACLQIGEPYVWGADGPDSFDCSGLTQYAWKSAGVSLTHYTGAQWNEGTPVSRENLRTGDLVFFYSDVHHMGIYVGNGLIVHAPHTGDVVRMAELSNMPYAGARRPG